MGALHGCCAVKFDSRNNLLSSINTILVIILPYVRLTTKKILLLLLLLLSRVRVVSIIALIVIIIINETVLRLKNIDRQILSPVAAVFSPFQIPSTWPCPVPVWPSESPVSLEGPWPPTWGLRSPAAAAGSQSVYRYSLTWPKYQRPMPGKKHNSRTVSNFHIHPIIFPITDTAVNKAKWRHDCNLQTLVFRSHRLRTRNSSTYQHSWNLMNMTNVIKILVVHINAY